tara:strand:- start:1339 stop:1584 length:246 start_codon:yes stop_codon:yes gene_type:complete
MKDNEILWKCRRGTKELDIMLKKYYINNYQDSSDAQKEAFVKLLDLEDPELFNLLLNKITLKDIAVNEIADIIRNMNSSYT